MHKYCFWYHVDTFLDTPNKFRNELVECQKTQPFRASKEALQYHMMNVLGRARWIFLLDSIKVIKHIINNLL